MFDYQCFLDELRQSEKHEKQKVVLQRDQWSLSSSIIEDEPYFQDYLRNFKVIPFQTPAELEQDFDWNLLLILCAGSFSSDYFFQFTDDSELPELNITVISGNDEVTKTVSELWSFQIFRLFEIFLEEQINLHSLLQDKVEAISIQSERKMKIESYKRKLYDLKLEQIKLERAKILS